MPKFTASQIQEKAKELVEKNVVQHLQELVDFVNQYQPELIPELVSDAYHDREIDQDEMFAYLKAEHNEDLVCLLEGWYTDEDNELEGKELFDAYHSDPNLISDEIEELYHEKNEDQPEILQYVQISNDWIARKLKEQGEIVIELFGLDVWCRQTFGQAFYLDYAWEALAIEHLEKYGLDN